MIRDQLTLGHNFIDIVGSKCFCQNFIRSSARTVFSTLALNFGRMITLQLGAITVDTRCRCQYIELCISVTLIQASKMATIWRRHCQERQKEHDRQIGVMKEKLSALQESMRKTKEEISWVQGEMNRTEDAWRKELTRQKEVNRQFQNALVRVFEKLLGFALSAINNEHVK
jgi:hypothetical protein